MINLPFLFFIHNVQKSVFILFLSDWKIFGLGCLGTCTKGAKTDGPAVLTDALAPRSLYYCT